MLDVSPDEWYEIYLPYFSNVYLVKGCNLIIQEKHVYMREAYERKFISVFNLAEIQELELDEYWLAAEYDKYNQDSFSYYCDELEKEVCINSEKIKLLSDKTKVIMPSEADKIKRDNIERCSHPKQEAEKALLRRCVNVLTREVELLTTIIDETPLLFIPFLPVFWRKLKIANALSHLQKILKLRK